MLPFSAVIDDKKGIAGRRAKPMAEQPKLPERIRRLQILRWDELIEKHGFTGAHLEWHESPVRRTRSCSTTPYSRAAACNGPQHWNV
jgi:hypothetical protein